MTAGAGSTAPLRCALLAALLTSAGCGKFQQARECGSFVKTVNAWLARPAPPSPAGSAKEPKQVAAERRQTAQSYRDLSQSLAALHVQNEELEPRVRRYREIADAAAKTLGDVADALDQGNLEKARQKRVEFDSVAQQEAPLVKEINGLCR